MTLVSPSTTAVTRAVLSSGVQNQMQTRPLLHLGDAAVPDSATDGYGIPAPALSAQLEASCQMDPAARRAWGIVTAVDTSTTYRLTIHDGSTATAVTYAATGGDDAAAILEGLRAAGVADSTINALVTLTVLTTWRDDSTVPALAVVQKPGQVAFAVTFDVSAGIGTMQTYVEPASASLDVYVKTSGTTTTALAAARYGSDGVGRWRAASAPGGRAVDIALDPRGLAERLDVSGYAAVYPRFHSMTLDANDDANAIPVPFSALYVGVG